LLIQFKKKLLKYLHKKLKINFLYRNVFPFLLYPVINLKVIKSYLSDFLEYGRYDYEEASYVKQNFIDNHNKEVNGIPRKNYELHVYSIRKDLHDRFLNPDFNRIDEIKLIVELAFKLSKLA
jgi:hypothetical protein